MRKRDKWIKKDAKVETRAETEEDRIIKSLQNRIMELEKKVKNLTDRIERTNPVSLEDYVRENYNPRPNTEERSSWNSEYNYSNEITPIFGLEA